MQIVPPEPTVFQAQRMYPNHPLLNPGGGGGGFAAVDFNFGMGGLPADVIPHPHHHQLAGMPFFGAGAGGGYAVMAAPASAYDLASTVPHPLLSAAGYELSTKRRACDQCNHSKVRCDFADPCGACTSSSTPSYLHVQY
jgi:hypothetical protein